MNKLLTITALFALSMSAACGMGRVFEKSVTVDPNTGEQIETGEVQPTPEALAALQAVDTVGDTAGAMGVPFASYAGEIAAGVLSLASLILTAKYRERGRALASVAKGVERGTTDGTIKRQILMQSVKDGTSSHIQKAVQSVT